MKRRYWLKRVLLVVLASLGIMLSCSWLQMQHIPQWYAPPWPTEEQLDGSQQELEQYYEAISEHMRRGRPFTVSFTTRQINDMLAVQQFRFPALSARLGELRYPCVTPAPAGIRIGVRLYWGEIRSIISVTFTPQVVDDELQFELHELRAGALKLPLTWVAYIAAAAQARTAKANSDLEDIWRQLPTGRINRTNLFKWPNGDIPFKITAIALENDRLVLHIEPLL